MRLFVALEIPPQVLDEIARFCAEIAPSLPRARWVRVSGIHLTLSFLGETPPSVLPALEQALERAFAPHPPLSLRVRGGGTFPSRGAARTAWLAVLPTVERDGDRLAALQGDVESAASAATGVPLLTRLFTPHLTLARANPVWPRPRSEVFLDAAQRDFGAPFEVRRGALIESNLSSGGARYAVRTTFPLRGTGEVPA